MAPAFMPFTFAHPAAVIPLYRVLRHHGVLSALVIGSMVPDFQNFLPFDVDRRESHSIAGMFWFCLPVGLLAYLVFHLLLEKPLRHLLPPVIAARVGAPRRMPLPSASGPLILLSLLLGIASHLAWDAFTHYSVVTVLILPMLSEHLFSVGEYHVYPYKLLQHASTLAGTLLVCRWIWHGLQRPGRPHTLPPPALLTQQRRRTITGILLAVPPLLGIGMAAHAFSISYGTMALKDVVREAVVTSISSFGLLVIAYCLVWHAFLKQDGHAAR